MYKTNNIIVPTQFTKDYVYEIIKKDHCLIHINQLFTTL